MYMNTYIYTCIYILRISATNASYLTRGIRYQNLTQRDPIKKKGRGGKVACQANWKWRNKLKSIRDSFECVMSRPSSGGRGWLDKWSMDKINENKVTFPDILPPDRGWPVAGRQPLSSQRVETFLPSEKEEGSSVETQGQLHHIFTTALMAVSHLSGPRNTWKYFKAE